MGEASDVVVFVVIGLWALLLGGVVAMGSAPPQTPSWRIGLRVAELVAEVEAFLMGLVVVSGLWLGRAYGMAAGSSLLLMLLFLRLRWLVNTAVGQRPERQPVNPSWLLREALMGASLIGIAVLARRWLPFLLTGFRPAP